MVLVEDLLLSFGVEMDVVNSAKSNLWCVVGRVGILAEYDRVK